MTLQLTFAFAATKINVRNQCAFVVSACDQGGGSGVTCYALQNGGQRQKDVGASWPGGLIWGFPSGSGDSNQGNNAKPQANLAEFTIGSNGQDYYDLSNVVSVITGYLHNPRVVVEILASGSPDSTMTAFPKRYPQDIQVVLMWLPGDTLILPL